MRLHGRVLCAPGEGRRAAITLLAFLVLCRSLLHLAVVAALLLCLLHRGWIALLPGQLRQLEGGCLLLVETRRRRAHT